jgi:hypothetical protein
MPTSGPTIHRPLLPITKPSPGLPRQRLWKKYVEKYTIVPGVHNQ